VTISPTGHSLTKSSRFLHPQRHPHGPLAPVDFPDDDRLDFASLLAKDDNVIDLEPLNGELDRHPPIVVLGQSR
jgi:hypothetical protein